MPNEPVDLPAALIRAAGRRASESGYASLADYFAALVAADTAAVPVDEDLDAALLKGLGSPSEEMTHLDWEAAKERLRQEFAAKKAS